MSQRTFQSALARLVTDPVFRDRVRSEAACALPDDLTRVESRRLIAAAGDRGMDITRSLHKGFRLGKLRSMLPLTCNLLGPRRLAREVGSFWRTNDCVSFYYIEEALAFCHHLTKRLRSGLRATYLEEVVEYERAGLELQQARTDETAAQVRIRFRHDPEILLTRLSRGQRPRGIPESSCTLTGTVAADGNIEWIITRNE